jgi:hypothetical protein
LKYWFFIRHVLIGGVAIASLERLDVPEIPLRRLGRFPVEWDLPALEFGRVSEGVRQHGPNFEQVDAVEVIEEVPDASSVARKNEQFPPSPN